MSTRRSVQQVRTRYAFIEAHRKRYSVQSMCPVAIADIADYIDSFYNPERRHSYLAGVSPDQFEAAHKRKRLH